MYLIINLAFLLFFLFIFSRFFSLFKKIFDYIIKESKKNNQANNNTYKDSGLDSDTLNWENNIQNIVDNDSNVHEYSSSSADFESSSSYDSSADYSSTNDFGSDSFSADNDIFSQFSSYTEAEKAIVYSEIISPPKSKRNNFY